MELPGPRVIRYGRNAASTARVMTPVAYFRADLSNSRLATGCGGLKSPTATTVAKNSTVSFAKCCRISGM